MSISDLFTWRVLGAAVLLTIAYKVFWAESSRSQQYILPVHQPQQHQPVYQPPPPSQSYRPTPYTPLLQAGTNMRPRYLSQLPHSLHLRLRQDKPSIIHRNILPVYISQKQRRPTTITTWIAKTRGITATSTSSVSVGPVSVRKSSIITIYPSGSSEQRQPVITTSSSTGASITKLWTTITTWTANTRGITASFTDNNQQDQPNEHHLVLRAYDRGDRAAAKFLSNQGKDHKRKMEQLNKEASNFIYLENNRHREPGEIDLHGLCQRSYPYTDTAIQEAKLRGASEIRLIVGKGTHSEGGEAILRPKIKALMHKYVGSQSLTARIPGFLLLSLMDAPRPATAIVAVSDEQATS
ncbi:hypothetical protein F5146DRAFT_1169142 [Armillaria mellea]|nr:hypothetical protein F5146DRAFT_1169142 [Armillaria mellea]